MSFLYPAFLAAAVALAVPILLHLLRKRERKLRVFPALRYLKHTTREHARIVRLRHLLLLAVRTLAVLLIVLAGARLVLPIGGNDAPPAAIALVIDNGLSSGAVVGSARTLDSLLARASEVLDRTGPRDRVWIVAAGAPWRVATPLSPEEARAELRELRSTHVSTDLSAALRRASALLDAAAPELREIVVVSDLRAEAVALPDPSETVRYDPVRIAPPPMPAGPNRGVGLVMVSGGLTPRSGDLGEVLIRVVGDAPAGATVRAYMDGRLTGSATTAPDGSAILQLPRAPTGWARGRVEVAPDDLRGDDAGFFVFESVPPPSVRVSGAISPFLEEALDVLADAGRILMAPEVAPTVWLIGGGGVVPAGGNAGVVLVPPDDSSLLPSLNRVLGATLPGWRLEGSLEGDGLGALPVTGGRLFGLLPELPAARGAYDIVTEGPDPDWVELLTLEDGRPLIVESDASGFPVVVLASPLGSSSSEISGSAAMLPLVDMLIGGSLASGSGSAALAGQPLPLAADAVGVRLPNGTVVASEGMRAFTETGTSGVYEVLGSEGQVLELMAVNATPPAATENLTAEEAVERLQGMWAGAVVGDPWPQSVLRDRRGREVTRPMLAGLLLLLLAETWLATADAIRPPTPRRSPTGPTPSEP